MDIDKQEQMSRIQKMAQDRYLRIYGKLGNHKVETHDGYLDKNCAECQRLTEIKTETEKLFQGLENSETREKLKTLVGKKILVVESSDMIDAVSDFPHEYGFRIDGKGKLPSDLSKYAKSEGVDGVIVHLSYADKRGELDNIIGAHNNGLRTVVLLTRIDAEDNQINAEKLDNQNINYIFKGTGTMIRAFAELAEQFKDSPSDSKI